MLDSALKFVVDELNSYLKAKTGFVDNIVSLGTVVDEAGKYAVGKQKIVLSLINIEQEAVNKQQLPTTSYVGGKTLIVQPELRLNLYVVLACRFDLYDQALKYLSHIMNFFQTRPVFTSDAYSALDSKISRISLDLQSPNYDQLNQIWAYLGGKHLPSLYYKVRVLSLVDADTPNIGPPILEVATKISSN